MPELPNVAAKGQEFVAKAVEAAIGAAKDPAPALGRMVDLVPTPGEVVDQVTATANELLVLGKDIQDKVIAALTFNA
jgi:hypothetical protein